MNGCPFGSFSLHPKGHKGKQRKLTLRKKDFFEDRHKKNPPSKSEWGIFYKEEFGGDLLSH
ncbi:MAG: hypothetical protein WBD61_07870, partial [Desulfobulbales bacterium]